MTRDYQDDNITHFKTLQTTNEIIYKVYISFFYTLTVPFTIVYFILTVL